MNKILTIQRRRSFLLKEGFQTVAIVNDSSLSHFSGLQQKFHHYVYLPSQTPFPMTEGTRQLMIYRWILDAWRKQQNITRAFYRPASEILFLSSIHSATKEHTILCLASFERLPKSSFIEELMNIDYHQQLHEVRQ